VNATTPWRGSHLDSRLRKRAAFLADVLACT